MNKHHKPCTVSDNKNCWETHPMILSKKKPFSFKHKCLVHFLVKWKGLRGNKRIPATCWALHFIIWEDKCFFCTLSPYKTSTYTTRQQPDILGQKPKQIHHITVKDQKRKLFLARVRTKEPANDYSSRELPFPWEGWEEVNTGSSRTVLALWQSVPRQVLRRECKTVSQES